MHELSLQLKETRDREMVARQDDPPEAVIMETDGEPEELGPDHGTLQGLGDDDHPHYFHKAKDSSDDTPEGDTNKFLTADQKGHLTGDGDGDEEHKHDSKMDKAIAGLPEKATPYDDDVLVLSDSEAAGALKKVKVSNIGGSGEATRWEPITNGDADNPELLFCDGDVMMVEVTV